MRHRRIDADDEIKSVKRGGGVREIAQSEGQVLNYIRQVVFRNLRARVAELEADPVDIVDFKKGSKGGERRASVRVVFEFLVARPDEAYRKPFCPMGQGHFVLA